MLGWFDSWVLEVWVWKKEGKFINLLIYRWCVIGLCRKKVVENWGRGGYRSVCGSWLNRDRIGGDVVVEELVEEW